MAGNREPTRCRTHAQAARQLQAEELEIAALRQSTETELRAVADALQRVSQQHQLHMGSQAMGSSQAPSGSRPAGRCLSGNATLPGSCMACMRRTWAGPSEPATAGSPHCACVRCSVQCPRSAYPPCCTAPCVRLQSKADPWPSTLPASATQCPLQLHQHALVGPSGFAGAQL